MVRRFIFLLIFVAATACSRKELSRGKVQQLIQSDQRFSTSVTALPLQDSGRLQGKHDAGEVEGLWLMSNYRFLLSAKGHQYFARDFAAGEPAPLANAARREIVEVTGITVPAGATDSSKVATFVWRYANLPPVVARYTGEESATHAGEASLQLFDDGWRLQDLALHERENRSAFRWPSDLVQELQRQLEAKRFTPERALNMAKPILQNSEPVLTFALQPAWNLPVTHGLTGQALNGEKINAFLNLLRQYGVTANGVHNQSGYLEVEALTPPAAWAAYERGSQFGGGAKAYAIYPDKTMTAGAFEYAGPDSDSASLTVNIAYSGCTPPCALYNALLQFPRFDYGGTALEKVFIGAGGTAAGTVSQTVYYERLPNDSWRITTVR